MGRKIVLGLNPSQERAKARHRRRVERREAKAFAERVMSRDTRLDPEEPKRKFDVRKLLLVTTTFFMIVAGISFANAKSEVEEIAAFIVFMINTGILILTIESKP